MFCSVCKAFEYPFQNIKRRSCVKGHVICSRCDNCQENCLICNENLVNFVCIEHNESIPRLFIIPISNSVSVATSLKSLPASSSSSSNRETDSDSCDIEEIVKSLKYIDIKQSINDHPIFGCFQVIGEKNQVSYTLSFDKTNDLAVLKNYRQVSSMKCKTSETSSQKVEYGSEETSFASQSSPTSLSEVSFKAKNDCSENDSIVQLYKNDGSMNASSTECPLSSEASSQLSFEKKKIAINAKRVKFTPYFEVDDQIPSQMEALDVIDSEFLSNIQDANESNSTYISRLPIPCPISTCRVVTTPSDFCNHIIIDHPYVEVIETELDKLINFTICRGANVNIIRCHQFFLLKGQMKDVGYGRFKDCLPVLLLTCKYNIQSIFPRENFKNPPKPSDDYFCVWLATVYKLPVKYSLNFWIHGRDFSEKTFIKSISSITSPISSFKSPQDIFDNSLSLSRKELETLTFRNGNNLNCQIVFE